MATKDMRPKPRFKRFQRVSFRPILEDRRIISRVIGRDWVPGVGWIYWMPGCPSWHAEYLLVRVI